MKPYHARRYWCDCCCNPAPQSHVRGGRPMKKADRQTRKAEKASVRLQAKRDISRGVS